MFLRGVIKQNITKATEHLHALNEDYTQKLEDARKHQMEAEKYYDEMVLKSKIDVEKNKVQILKEAHDTQESIVSQARKQSVDILAQAERARDAMMQEMERQVEERALERACELVEEVLPREMGEKVHADWVAELLKRGLDELGRLNLPEDLKAAELVTAFPLTPEQKKSLEKGIRDRIGKNLPVTERSDAALIAGVKIVLGSVIIDGSLRSKIQEAVRHAGHSA
ncbi:MAG TPA: F0F1 ATP synthase subunit delta [Candidatus Eisenbacteria bacterium]|nr:F0F1 ATP synthase subunit delta [Candidatus Eisenbacteria bacterium]